ncbi:hypothetical protein FACS1894172_09140 [Spirochaetia bacterium]|nr:hypothetical protein FACS1894164_00900 [Spirochaetia bacterium]GHU32463.1 hypothetical protein FACS1894172_09140 [Spirochaetia bacterium]
MAGLLDTITKLFSNNSDSDSDKKKLLKSIAKDLEKNKYNKFYRVKSAEVTPLCGKFFYDMYKIIAAARPLMANADKSTLLKHITIESFLDKNLREIKKRLEPESIIERFNTIQVKELSQQVQEDIVVFCGAFSSEKTTTMNRYYNMMLDFSQFVSFDFYALVRKFDPGLNEKNLTDHPKLNSVKPERLSENLKDFLEVSYHLNSSPDWEDVFNLLKNYKNGVLPVDPGQWKKMLVRLHDVQQSGILLLMVRHIDQNPVLQFKSSASSENIVEPYLNQVTTQAHEAIDEIVRSQKNSQADSLCMDIFGTTSISRLKYYNESTNDIFTRRRYDGFTHIVELNYLQAFLTDYYKSKIRELYDIIIVRGQWKSNVLSQAISDAYHIIGAVAEQLGKFDDLLAENKDRGARLRVVLLKAEKSKSQEHVFQALVQTIDAEAVKMIDDVASSVAIIAEHTASVIEDIQKNPHELILNWKELESAMAIEGPILLWLKSIHDHMSNFVQLIRLFVQPIEQPDAE